MMNSAIAAKRRRSVPGKPVCSDPPLLVKRVALPAPAAYMCPSALSSCKARNPPKAIATHAARPMNAPDFRSAPSGKSMVR